MSWRQRGPSAQKHAQVYPDFEMLFTLDKLDVMSLGYSCVAWIRTVISRGLDFRRRALQRHSEDPGSAVSPRSDTKTNNEDATHLDSLCGLNDTRACLSPLKKEYSCSDLPRSSISLRVLFMEVWPPTGNGSISIAHCEMTGEVWLTYNNGRPSL